ncbi:MAG: M1 family metallopeptidase [Bacteroidota bacterium]
MRTSLFVSLLFFSLIRLTAQSPYANISAEELRGALRPERTCFDVHYYALHLAVDMSKQEVSGYVDVDFITVTRTDRIQLDLYRNMLIEEISWNGQRLPYERVHDAFFVDFPRSLTPNSLQSVRVKYYGIPMEAKNPPWDGGFVWSLDNKDRTWLGVACQGAGASLWWPNKDHLSDKPDSVLISITVPEHYFVAANGNLRETELVGRKKERFDWFVSYPINNYNVSFNVGHYLKLSDAFVASDGRKLALDYYVIDYNEKKAKKHFQQVKPMLRAYEHYLGDYPFWEDGFALIETPYLGMEHQSGIAYGNRYMRGYLGGMLPRGMNWDYIIIHETGHEYFGNSICINDHAELWIHESFTTYLESLYVEYHHGKEKAQEYLLMQRPYVRGREAVIGPLNVNYQGWETSDHYYKGAWMLHTLRNIVNDDPLWFGMLRSLYQRFKGKNVTTHDITRFMSEYLQADYSIFFDQYLNYPNLPKLEFRQNGKQVEYRWQANCEAFNMPIDVTFRGVPIRIQPLTTVWSNLGKGKMEDVVVLKDNFLIATTRLQD